jgi:hypothetical protein
MADDIWIFDLKSGALENITENPAQDIFPRWASNGRIYFVSERTARANLFSYPQLNKQALIIDVRGNGGGNVSPMIIERLRRELTMIQISRNNPRRPRRPAARPQSNTDHRILGLRR